MTPEKLTRLTNVSTIASAIITALGVIVAVVTIVAGAIQFRKGQDSEHESKAVDLFIKYDELMERAASSKVKDNPENSWREYMAIGIAEAIFRLKRGDRGWENSVRGMVLDHKDFLKSHLMDCETYDSDFVKLVKEEAQADLCRK